jgi:hypothetical protein
LLAGFVGSFLNGIVSCYMMCVLLSVSLTVHV